jgi:hypothetical protein
MLTKAELALQRRAESEARIAKLKAYQLSLIPDYGFLDGKLKDEFDTGKVFRKRANTRPTIAAQIAEGYKIA